MISHITRFAVPCQMLTMGKRTLNTPLLWHLPWLPRAARVLSCAFHMCVSSYAC